MGKLMLNGTSYGGSFTTATNASYDNTTSGLTATNVQSAIDENAESIETIDTTLGSTSISSIGDGSVTGAISTLNSSLTPTTFNNLVFDTSVVTIASKNMFTIGKKLFVDVFFSSNVNISTATILAQLTGGYEFDVTNKNGGMLQSLSASYGIQYWLSSSEIIVRTGTPMVADSLYQLTGVFDLE